MFFTECALVVLKGELCGYRVKQATITVTCAPQHHHIVSELLLHQDNLDTLSVVFQNK